VVDTGVGLTSTPAAGALPSKFYGVTIDDVTNLDQIVDSLRSLPKKPFTRVVFDPGMTPTDYSEAVNKIGAVSYVMGEPVDSHGFKDLSLEQYRQRFAQYLDGFGSRVDLWEIGNEINGEWTGTTPDVIAKLQAAVELTKTRAKKTALTLYYNQGCAEDPAREMLAWSSKNVPADLRANIDYLLVSYYPDDCSGPSPDWPAVFAELAKQYPNAKFGIGEVGTEKAANKEALIRKYYSMAAPVSNWVGGHFWWYFKQDAVPKTKPLWFVFRDVMQAN
jgi:hypothetical protein